MQDTGYWILDAGCRILDTGCWMLDAGFCKILNIKSSIINVSQEKV
jgi:hypothetical protein